MTPDPTAWPCRRCSPAAGSRHALGWPRHDAQNIAHRVDSKRVRTESSSRCPVDGPGPNTGAPCRRCAPADDQHGEVLRIALRILTVACGHRRPSAGTAPSGSGSRLPHRAPSAHRNTDRIQGKEPGEAPSQCRGLTRSVRLGRLSAGHTILMPLMRTPPG